MGRGRCSYGGVHLEPRGSRRAITGDARLSRRQNLEDLGDFLRSRRAQPRPEDVGVHDDGSRRTPGLRRSEVAAIAGVSLTWYTWLGQGRDIGVSLQVLRAIARALRLDPAETAHLARLAGHGDALEERPLASVGADGSLHRLLDALVPSPAYALTAWWEFVAWNEGFQALSPDVQNLQDDERNLLWAMFVVPAVRELVVNWEVEAQRLVAQFRAEAGALARHGPYHDVLTRLRERSPEFDELWCRYGRRWVHDEDALVLSCGDRRVRSRPSQAHPCRPPRAPDHPLHADG